MNAISEFFGFVLEQIKRNIFAFILLLLPLPLFIVLSNKFIDFSKLSFQYKPFPLMLLIIIHLGTVLTFSNQQIYSNHQLYYNLHSPTLMVERFGLITTLRLDATRHFLGFDEQSDFIEIVEKEEEIIEKPEEIEEEIIYNIIDIDWEELISNETDDTLKNMHQYFQDTAPTNQNDWTGKFKDKNLIWILAESLDHIAIDEDLTPTLYKMANEGLNFTNFYTPIYLSTIDGEYMTLSGLLPKAGVWSLYQSRDNYLPFSLGNQMGDLGYQTPGYHNGEYTYYRRHLSHPNLGFDWDGCRKNLDINCNLWPQSDLEMVEATLPKYINDSPFAIYYLTISGHLQYNRYNHMANRNWEAVADLPYSTPVKCYLSQHIELDKALEYLIATLEENNLAEDTVIAISSDHWPYGLTPEQLNERSDINRDDFFDRDRLPFIIWHEGIAGKQVNKLASTVDILPTLSNLFGLEYDSRLMIGQDIFAETKPIVIYANRSWITEKGRYNKSRDEFYPTNGPVSEEYIERINNIVYNRFQISRLILDQDYYRKILKDN